MNAPSWSLRPARPGDRDFLFDLNEATMREHVEHVWGWDDEEQAAFFENRFQPDGWQIIQADGQDVGVLILEETDREIYLAEIQILPEFQGRGVGSSIVRPPSVARASAPTRARRNREPRSDQRVEEYQSQVTICNLALGTFGDDGLIAESRGHSGQAGTTASSSTG